MNSRTIAPLLISAFLVPFAARASAGDVLVVSSSGPFTSIQAAVDAASEFDTVLVRASFDPYVGDVVVHQKSLAIVGDILGAWGAGVRGQIQVDSIAADGLVVLGQLGGLGTTTDGYALRTLNNDGAVRIEGCTLRGKDMAVFQPGAGACAWVGIDADTQFIGTSLTGGSPRLLNVGVESGKSALFSRSPMLQLFGCTVTGGLGSFHADESGWSGGNGGIGLEVADGITNIVGSAISGGRGGDGEYDSGCVGGSGGGGGIGIVVGSSSPPSSATPNVSNRGGANTGGVGGLPAGSDCGIWGLAGANGAPVAVYNGSWTPIGGVARHITGSPLARDNGTPATFSVSGAPGDRVYVQIEELVSPLAPVVVGAPAHASITQLRKLQGVFLGTIPPSGTLAASLPIAPLASSVASVWWRLHTAFAVASGGVVRGNDFVLVVLNAP